MSKIGLYLKISRLVFLVYKRIKNENANNLKFPVSSRFETNCPQKVFPFINESTNI